MEAQVRPGLQEVPAQRAVPEVMALVEQQVRPGRPVVREVPEPVERQARQVPQEVPEVLEVPARQVLRALPEVAAMAEASRGISMVESAT